MKIVRLTPGGNLVALTYADRLMRRCNIPIVLAGRWDGRLHWGLANRACARHFAVTRFTLSWEKGDG